MTFSKAFELAIKAVQKDTGLTEKQRASAIEMLTKAQEKSNEYGWTQESIIKALYDYKDRVGRAPTANDLKERGLPSYSTVQTIFHKKPATVLNELFSDDRKGQKRSSVFYDRFSTKEDWLNHFREQITSLKKEYVKINSRLYNRYKGKNNPSWQTIAINVGLTTWTELAYAAGLEKQILRSVTATDIQVTTAVSPTIQTIEKLIEERRELNQDLYRMLYTKYEKHPKSLKEKYINEAP